MAHGFGGQDHARPGGRRIRCGSARSMPSPCPAGHCGSAPATPAHYLYCPRLAAEGQRSSIMTGVRWTAFILWVPGAESQTEEEQVPSSRPPSCRGWIPEQACCRQGLPVPCGIAAPCAVHMHADGHCRSGWGKRGRSPRLQTAWAGQRTPAHLPLTLRFPDTVHGSECPRVAGRRHSLSGAPFPVQAESCPARASARAGAARGRQPVCRRSRSGLAKA